MSAPATAEEVWRHLPEDALTDVAAAAMAPGHGGSDAMTLARSFIAGERARVAMLGDAFWPHFYRRPIATLRSRALLPAAFTLTELGPSLGLHLATLPAGLQPRQVFGIEQDRHVVATGRRATAVLAALGLIRSRVRIVQGRHDAPPQPADVAIMSLVSQYDAGEEGAYAWLSANGAWGINGDLCPARGDTTEGEIGGGTIPLRSKRQPGIRTGFSWRLLGRPERVPLCADRLGVAGLWICEAGFGLTAPPPGVVDLGEDSAPASSGAQRSGRVTLVRGRDGAWAYIGWAYAPRDAEARAGGALEEIFALALALMDLYGGIQRATGGRRQWDGGAAAGLPAWAAARGAYTAVLVHSVNQARRADPVSPRLPLAILLRYRREVEQVARAGLISVIGADRVFADVDAFYARVQHWMAPDSGLEARVALACPPLVTTLSTADPSAFARLVGAAGTWSSAGRRSGGLAS